MRLSPSLYQTFSSFSSKQLFTFASFPSLGLMFVLIGMSLPQELMDKILQQAIRDTKTARACNLAHRSCCTEALRFMYRRLCLHGRQNLKGLLCLVQQEPHILQYVSAVVLSGWSSRDKKHQAVLSSILHEVLIARGGNAATLHIEFTNFSRSALHELIDLGTSFEHIYIRHSVYNDSHIYTLLQRCTRLQYFSIGGPTSTCMGSTELSADLPAFRLWGLVYSSERSSRKLLNSPLFQSLISWSLSTITTLLVRFDDECSWAA